MIVRPADGFRISTKECFHATGTSSHDIHERPCTEPVLSVVWKARAGQVLSSLLSGLIEVRPSWGSRGGEFRYHDRVTYPYC